MIYRKLANAVTAAEIATECTATSAAVLNHLNATMLSGRLDTTKAV